MWAVELAASAATAPGQQLLLQPGLSCAPIGPGHGPSLPGTNSRTSVKQVRQTVVAIALLLLVQAMGSAYLAPIAEPLANR